MRIKALKQRNLLRLMLRQPIRILSRARKFYIKSLVDCSGAAGYGGGDMVAPVSVLPKSFSVNSSSATYYSQDQEGRLSRTLSKKLNKDEEKKDLGLQRRVVVRQQPTSSMELNGMRMRSYSVGLGKIGRIDEERPCSFREDEVDSSADLYPRSRSYAVNRISRFR